MRSFTLLLAFFVAFTSAKLWDKLLIPDHAKPHKADSPARVTATVSVPADPSCKKDSDCQTGSSSGQCVNGICMENPDGPKESQQSKDTGGVAIPWEPVKYGPGKGVVVRRDQLVGRAVAEESFATGEEEDIMKDLGDNYVEVDGPSGQFNVKKRKMYQFDGDADDGSDGKDEE